MDRASGGRKVTKKWAVNYEIPFARAQNQLHAANISFGGETIGRKRPIFWPQPADSLLDTNIILSDKQMLFQADFVSR
jgi:hypothetical protein